MQCSAVPLRPLPVSLAAFRCHDLIGETQHARHLTKPTTRCLLFPSFSSHLSETLSVISSRDSATNPPGSKHLTCCPSRICVASSEDGFSWLSSHRWGETSVGWRTPSHGDICRQPSIHPSPQRHAGWDPSVYSFPSSMASIRHSRGLDI